MFVIKLSRKQILDQSSSFDVLDEFADFQSAPATNGFTGFQAVPAQPQFQATSMSSNQNDFGAFAAAPNSGNVVSNGFGNFTAAPPAAVLSPTSTVSSTQNGGFSGLSPPSHQTTIQNNLTSNGFGAFNAPPSNNTTNGVMNGASFATPQTVSQLYYSLVYNNVHVT